MTLHRLRLVASLALIALVLAACQAGGTATGPTEGDDVAETGAAGEAGAEGDAELPIIRVGSIATASFAPLMITASKFAEEEGFQVEIIDFPGGGEILTGVTTGELDVGAAGIGSGSYNAFQEGLPFAMVAPQHNGFVEDYFMLSETVAGSQEEAAQLAGDMSELSGETFTVNAPGVVTEYLLSVALERGGLAFEDVEVEYMPFPDMVPALAGGAAVGGIVSEPFPTAAEQQGSAYRPWETPDEEPWPFTVVIYNTDWAEGNPELAEAYMRAHVKTAEFLDEVGWEDDEVLEIISELTDIEADTLRGTRSHYLPPDMSVDFDRIAQIQQFYMDQGTLSYDEVVDDQQLWDLRWRDAALGQ